MAVTVFTTGASAVDGKAGASDCGWAQVAAAFSCTPTFESLSAQEGCGGEGSSAVALSKSSATLAHIGGVLERQRVATGCDGGKTDANWVEDAGEDGTVCTVVEVLICPALECVSLCMHTTRKTTYVHACAHSHFPPPHTHTSIHPCTTTHNVTLQVRLCLSTHSKASLS